jgi:Phage integrase family
MVLLAVLTGLRVGEILALRWQDVDLDRGELRLVQAVYPGCLVPRNPSGNLGLSSDSSRDVIRVVVCALHRATPKLARGE